MPNQVDGWNVKGQVQAAGLVEMAKCRVNVFEVPMITEEFCEQYSDGLAAVGVTESDDEEVFA